MLEQALAAETQAGADYKARIRQAEGCEEFGLKVVRENQVADETRQQEEIERILAGWKKAQIESTRQVERWEGEGLEGRPVLITRLDALSRPT